MTQFNVRRELFLVVRKSRKNKRKYANAVAHEVQRLCVESCNGCQIGHPSQGQHDCLLMNENQRWQMYGLQAIERVNAKRMVWCEFAEAMRVLKLAVKRDVLEHLQQLENKRSRFYVCLFIDGTTSEHREPRTTMYAELFVSLAIRRPTELHVFCEGDG